MYNPLQNRPVRPFLLTQHTPSSSSSLSYKYHLQPPGQHVSPTDAEACATRCNLSLGAVPRISYRGQKGIPFTYRVSPQQLPNVQSVAEPAGSRRPRRSSPPRPLRRLRRVDLSLHHDPNQGCGKVFRGTKTRLHRPKCSTSRTPTSSALFVRFCHRAADLGRVMHPHLKPLFVIGDRTGDFHQSVHRLFR